jgi:hypothetical protein
VFHRSRKNLQGIGEMSYGENCAGSAATKRDQIDMNEEKA